MPVNSAVTASPPPHFGHGWMWVEWKSSLTDSLSHTHTYLLLLFSPSPPLPPSPLLLTHTFSLSHQCVTVHVKTFSSIVLPLSLSCLLLNPTAGFQFSQTTAVFTDWALLAGSWVKSAALSWFQLRGKKESYFEYYYYYYVFLNIYFFIHCHGYNMSEREQPWL